MEYAIQASGLTKIFQPGIGLYDLFIRPRQSLKRFKALDNLNLEVKKGKVFALLGPNGAGKTTLMKILATLIYPDAGTVRVNGYDPVSDDLGVKRSIGMLINDERSFYWRLTGYQNLEFFAYLNGLRPKETVCRIKELCGMLDIEQPHKRFQEYSTGTKQKLALARALLRDPEILFMDEPTRSLDPLQASAFRKFIKDRFMGNKKRTVFFITHNPDEAEGAADEIAILDKGILKACGDMEILRSCAGMPQAPLKVLYPKLLGKLR